MVKKILFGIFVMVFAGSSFLFAADESIVKNSKIKRLAEQLYDNTKAMDAERRLSAYGKEATEYLLPVLENKNNEPARVSALRAIADIGDPAAEDEVVKLLKDNSQRIRQEAARALSTLAEKESTVEPLKKLLSDPSGEVRYNAIRALSRLAPKDEVQLFVGALGDFDPRVRLFSVIALGKLKAAESVQYLARLTGDYDPSVRLELVEALGKIGTDECFQPLAQLAGDPELNTRILAIEKISLLKANGVDDFLVTVADGGDFRVAASAISSLVERKSPLTLLVAKRHIGDEHMSVKVAAIEALGVLGSKGEEEILKPLLAAESTMVRQKAKEALEKVSGRI